MSAMQPLAVHHVSVNVGDVEESLAFYVDVLGLQARDDRPDFGFGGAWLDAGGQQVHLIEGAPPAGKGEHFALLVADLDATIGELRDRGVAVSDSSPVGTGAQAFLSDPSGNLIELHQADAFADAR
jgi:catechol 2,3-dioxygenase-like lactoylglutathione lyase family enzyme